MVELALGQNRCLRIDLLQPAHERGACLGLDPRELVLGGAVLEESLPLVGDGRLDLRRIDALFHVHLQLEHAGQHMLIDIDRNVIGEFVLVDQPLVKP